MKKKVFVLLMGILVLCLTGCGNKSDNSSEEVTEVGKLDLEAQAINSFSDGYAAIKQNGKWGFIDKLGNIVIEPQYNDVGNFIDGLSFACIGDNYSNQNCGYIDKDGKTVIDFKYKDAYDFEFGYAIVKNDSSYSVIDKNGKEIFTTRYITTPISENLFVTNGTFGGNNTVDGFDIITLDGKVIADAVDDVGKVSDGLIKIKEKRDNNAKYGYIDEQGNVVIDYIYDNAGDFSEGLAPVIKNNKLSYINTSGDYILKDVEGAAVVYRSYSNGLVGILNNGKYSFYDTNGKLVFELNSSKKSGSHADQDSFSEGLLYLVNDENKFGYVDTKGKLVIDYQYEKYAGEFSEGLAKVMKDENTFEFINSKGKTIIGGKITKNSTSNSSNETSTSSNNESSSNSNSTSSTSSSSNTNTNSENSSNGTTSTQSNTSSESSDGIPINNMTIKYGTYKGINAIEGDTLVIQKDGTAIYNGDKKTTYYVGTYDFGQDSSSSDLTMAIIFDDTSFGWCGALYPSNNGKTLSCGSGFDYTYSGN